MAYDFRWNDWNLEHIGDHNILPEEAEYVINHAKPPYPEHREDDKWLVIDSDRTLFVIHARPLTDREKRRYRRRRR